MQEKNEIWSVHISCKLIRFCIVDCVTLNFDNRVVKHESKKITVYKIIYELKAEQNSTKNHFVLEIKKSYFSFPKTWHFKW